MDHVTHVPQSPASHVGGYPPNKEPSADMLQPDPRDTFFLSKRRLQERVRMECGKARPPSDVPPPFFFK